MAMPERDPTVPAIFISYSWDDDEHREWVKQLATRLRKDGVDVTLDLWHSEPGDQITEFMERAVRDNDFVIAVCTPRFKERADRSGGVGYEGDIMTAYAFRGGGKRKFIPVLRRGSWSEAAPTWLLGRTKIDLSSDLYSELEYERLLRTLHGARDEAAQIGPRPDREEKKGSQAGASSPPVDPPPGSSTPQHQSALTPSPGDSMPEDDLQPEYDFRSLRGVVRGKYAARYRERLRLVRLAPDVSSAFPDEMAVNEALRQYLNWRQERQAANPV
ncbi:MAG: toll/interleukin-1 receptor domain-containing protein [Isosphaeraceae bacterium]